MRANVMTPANRRVVAAAVTYVDARIRLQEAEELNGQPGSYKGVVAAEDAARRALYRLADAVDGLEREERLAAALRRPAGAQ